MLKMIKWSPVMVLVCLLMLNPLGVMAGGPSKDKANDIKDLFNEEMRTLRAGNMFLPMSYLEVDGVAYGYHLPRRLIQMAKTGDTFRLRKFKTDDNMLKLELETNRKARLKIHIFDPEKEVSATLLDKVLPLVLADVFDFGIPPNFPRVVVNTTSGLAHLGACNHLPADSLRIAFADDISAEAAGHRLCPACFPPDPPLPYYNYMPIRNAALETTRLYERAFPPVPNQALQDSVQSLGETLLNHLPFQEKGFSYRFRVVESEAMQGQSFPTGFVYITDRLLAAMEDEIELAHVLAHETAHCELHLKPNAQIPEPNFLLEAGWKQYYKRVRWRETEADLVAINTLSRLYPGEDVSAAAIKILSKLQFANEAIPLMEGNSYSTHPPFGSRLEWLKNGFFPVAGTHFYEARDKSGDWVCRVRVLGGGTESKKNPVIHLLVEMSAGAKDDNRPDPGNNNPEFGEAKDGGYQAKIIFANGTGHKMNSRGDVSLYPGFMEIVTYEIKGMKKKNYGISTSDDPKIYDPAHLKGIKLSLSGDLKWFVVPLTEG